MAKRKVEEVAPTRYDFETFLAFNEDQQDMLTQAEPSCFNRTANFRKWRITAEIVDEPVEVLAERLRKLWRECDNMHHLAPLKAAAREISIELDAAECGFDRKKR